MSTHSKNKIEKLGRCSSSGQVAKGCCCIQHNNWSPNSKKSRVINLLPRSIEKQLREKGLLSGNFICKSCAIFAKEFFGYSSKRKTAEGNSDSSNDEIGNSELPETVRINLEIQRLAFTINCLHDKYKVNFKPTVDLLPLATVKNVTKEN